MNPNMLISTYIPISTNCRVVNLLQTTLVTSVNSSSQPITDR